MRDFGSKIRKQLAPRQDYLAFLNRKPRGQWDLLTSMTMDRYFPGKTSHCRNVFFLSRVVERWGGRQEKRQNCQRQRKNWTPAWSGVLGAFTKEFFLFMTEWYSFFLVWACFFFPLFRYPRTFWCFLFSMLSEIFYFFWKRNEVSK